MDLVNLILLCLTIVPIYSQDISELFRDSINPTKLLSNPQLEVLNSLSSVGIGNDDIQRPAKKFLLHVYDQLHNGEALRNTASRKNNRLHSADTVRSLTSKVPIYEGNGRVRLTFNLSSISSTELTSHAELHIRPLRRQQNRRHRLKVTVKGNQGRKGDKLTVRIASESLSYYGYLMFDITYVIRKAMRQTARDSTKLIEVTVIHRARREIRGTKSANALRAIWGNPKYINEDDGLLVIYSEDKHFGAAFKHHVTNAATNLHTKKSRRDKRAATTAKERTQLDRSCAHHDMWVDFHELGWSRWILYPPRYNAYLCGGKCPSPVDWAFDPTNHAILQSILRLGDTNIKRPCCVPSKLGAISMLYFERDEIVVRHHEDMMATRCGCR